MTAPKTPTVAFDVYAERAHMALAEAGYPKLWVIAEDDHLSVIGLDRADVEQLKVAYKALSLSGAVGRCLPCWLAHRTEPRVSPDCEGTGRCAP